MGEPHESEIVSLSPNFSASSLSRTRKLHRVLVGTIFQPVRNIGKEKRSSCEAGLAMKFCCHGNQWSPGAGSSSGARVHSPLSFLVRSILPRFRQKKENRAPDSRVMSGGLSEWKRGPAQDQPIK